MNLMKDISNKDKKLLTKAGIHIENRDYTKDELRGYVSNIEDFIMSHSTKNGDITRLNNEYDSILHILTK